MGRCVAGFVEWVGVWAGCVESGYIKTVGTGY